MTIRKNGITNYSDERIRCGYYCCSTRRNVCSPAIDIWWIIVRISSAIFGSSAAERFTPSITQRNAAWKFYDYENYELNRNNAALQTQSSISHYSKISLIHSKRQFEICVTINVFSQYIRKLFPRIPPIPPSHQ